MNRSPDDIFAAQFWAWPDPALKRDAHGRVIFVNAAFLHLFGGTVDAWRGQVVQGWAPPQPGPQPNRFEIRTPAGDGYPEQVYDWLESCGQDGSGFALARNVTAFVTTAIAAPDPVPQADTPPVEQATHTVADNTAAASQTQAVQQPAQTQAVVDVAPTLDPSSFVAAAVAAPQPDPAVAAQDIDVAPSVAVAPQAESQVPQAPVTQAAPEAAVQAQLAPQSAVAPEPVQSTALDQTATMHEINPHEMAVASVAEDNRDFERRALPIENEEAVLGNNWRDAVIAKAIGGEDEAEAGTGPSASQPGAIRILLAEDNAINALLTRTLLEADGHTVETVEDGVLAVQAMKTQDFDMIFMDMRMPNMDGLEATRKIRALPNVSKELPIVALTANAFDDDRNACFDSGMNDFMTKPVSAEELSEMVLRWTTQREQKLAS